MAYTLSCQLFLHLTFVSLEAVWWVTKISGLVEVEPKNGNVIGLRESTVSKAVGDGTDSSDRGNSLQDIHRGIYRQYRKGKYCF